MIDVTVPISPKMPRFPGDPEVSISRVMSISGGDPTNVSLYCFGSHTGTHIDPPRHFLAQGQSIDEIPLETLVGPASLVNMENVRQEIAARHLAEADITPGTRRLLLKTRNSALWDDPEGPFVADYVHLAEDGARWLIDRGISLVGIDYLSIEAFGATGYPVHKTLLSNNVVVVEGLDLRRAVPGDYHLVCLPLLIKGGDGGQARVLLL